MSILVDKVDPKTKRYQKDSVQVRKPDMSKGSKDVKSAYTETPEQKLATASFLKDFRNGWQTMHLPRIELNDLSLYQRHIVDMLAFNTYQPNDGQPMMEDRLGGWKSQAIRPVVRNKAISIAAHRTAGLTVPKIAAYNDEDEEQTDSAKVMGYLTDWAKEQADYPFQSLFREIMAIYSPISWGYSEYTEVFRQIKDSKNADGTWNYIEIPDEDETGFQHVPLSTDQVFFPNFYERNAQKQDFIILRRILSFDRAAAKYSQSPNWQFVKPGIVVTMSDANDGFYDVYDPHMRQDEVEEVIRWRKSDDSKTIKVNGIWMTDCDAKNPRADHQYPLDAYYFLPINERCIAGKSLVFAMQSDANIINTFYQIILDGSILNLFPPTITSGSDKVGVDVIVPGLNLAFADKDVEITPLKTANDQSIATAMNTMAKVESSISESSQDPVQQGQSPVGPPSTAYEISRIEQNAATVLGFSMKFRAQNTIDYGKLLVSDILQYMTMAQASDIVGKDEGGLIYKTFYAKDTGASGKTNKIQFDANMPPTMTEDDKLNMSFALLKANGKNMDTTLWKVNPILFRQHKYVFTIDQDVLNPRSAELTRAFDIETYDAAIQSPVADQVALYTDLLMASNPKTARNPKKYVQQQAPQAPQIPGSPGSTQPGQYQNPNQPPQPQPTAQVNRRGSKQPVSVV